MVTTGAPAGAHSHADAGRVPIGVVIRVFAWACMGYLYVFGILALLVGALPFLVHALATGHNGYGAGRLLFADVVLLGAVVSALWVKLPPIEGIRLNRDRAHDLFECLDRICDGAGVRRFSEVVITEQVNASACQMPRFGLLGGWRNHLIMGLPLMQALSVAEFEGVMTHELAHLSNRHGRSGVWLYRVFRHWDRLAGSCTEEKRTGEALFVRFMHWYVPRFSREALALAKAHERQADAGAVDAVGARVFGDGLVRIEYVAERLDEEYWGALNKLAVAVPDVPATVFTDLLSATRTIGAQSVAADWFATAIARDAEDGDPHPSLRERLVAAGYGTDAPPAERPGATAAEALLGATLPELATELDTLYAEGAREGWTNTHEEMQALIARRNELEERWQASGLTPDEAWELVMACRDLESDEAAGPACDYLLQLAPDDVRGNLLRGILLLEKDDSTAMCYLTKGESAPAPWYRLMSLEARARHYRRIGEVTQAAECRAAIDRLNRDVDLMGRERRDLGDDAMLQPVALPDDILRTMVAGVSSCPFWQRAYVVKASVKHLPEYPCVFVVLEIRKDEPSEEEAGQDAFGGMTRMLEILGKSPWMDISVVPPSKANAKWVKRARRIKEACIFDRG